MPPKSNYFAPIRADKFTVTQVFYAVDPVNYPITGHHPATHHDLRRYAAPVAMRNPWNTRAA